MVIIPSQLWPLIFFHDIGYGAVDLFFLLSGFGLFYGRSKKHYSIVKFYKRRLLRVFPAYWIVVAIYYLILLVEKQEVSTTDSIYMAAGLNFYLDGDLFIWFIPSIAVCYAIFPAIVKLVGFDNHISNLVRNLANAVLSALLISVLIIVLQWNHLLILTTRFPIFLFGIYVGYLACNDFSDESWFNGLRFSTIMIVIGVLLLFFTFRFTTPSIRWLYGLWWYPLIIMTYPLCFLLASSFHGLDNSYSNNLLYCYTKKALSFCGRYSLEIYLIHVVVFRLAPINLKILLPSMVESNIRFGRVPEYVIYTIFTLLLAPLLSKLAQWDTLIARLSWVPSR
jgi:peptidoglycan/LPS O-acetylase OafA/YrhL